MLQSCDTFGSDEVSSRDKVTRPQKCQHLDRKEIRTGQDCHVRPDEVFPVNRLFSLRSGRNGVPLQNVTHRLIRDPVAEISQRSYNPIIAPTGILFRHPDDKILQR